MHLRDAPLHLSGSPLSSATTFSTASADHRSRATSSAGWPAGSRSAPRSYGGPRQDQTSTVSSTTSGRSAPAGSCTPSCS